MQVDHDPGHQLGAALPDGGQHAVPAGGGQSGHRLHRPQPRESGRSEHRRDVRFHRVRHQRRELLRQHHARRPVRLAARAAPAGTGRLRPDGGGNRNARGAVPGLPAAGADAVPGPRAGAVPDRRARARQLQAGRRQRDLSRQLHPVDLESLQQPDAHLHRRAGHLHGPRRERPIPVHRRPGHVLRQPHADHPGSAARQRPAQRRHQRRAGPAHRQAAADPGAALRGAEPARGGKSRALEQRARSTPRSRPTRIRSSGMRTPSTISATDSPTTTWADSARRWWPPIRPSPRSRWAGKPAPRPASRRARRRTASAAMSRRSRRRRTCRCRSTRSRTAPASTSDSTRSRRSRRPAGARTACAGRSCRPANPCASACGSGSAASPTRRWRRSEARGGERRETRPGTRRAGTCGPRRSHTHDAGPGDTPGPSRHRPALENPR